MQDLSFLAQAAVAAVKEGGNIILEAWHKPRKITMKGKIDLVTETDFAVQAFLKEKLNHILPEASFVGEEGDKQSGEAARFSWIVDPVDGTTNFVHKIPFVATSVALCDNGRPCLGIVNAPLCGECFHAVRGGGAFCDDRPIKVSAIDKLVGAVIGTGFPYDINPGLKTILARLAAVLPATQGLRRLGAAALDLSYVACGRLDGFYEAELKPWDMAAGWLIVEEAGGAVTSIDGEPACLGAPLVATNGKIHNDLLGLLKDD